MKKMGNILLRLSLLLHSFLLFLLPSNNTQIKNPKKRPPPSDVDDHHLRRVFDSFDCDKDGRITLSELSLSLRRMGISISDAEVAALIESADSDGDGCVDAGEFEELYKTLTSAGGGRRDMEEAFGVFDRDGDGFISEEELKGVLDSIGGGIGRSLEECRRMIQRVDQDGDGKVSFLEFQVMMKDVVAF